MKGNLILESFLETFEDYVGQFVGENMKYDRCYVLLLDQFSQFVDNIKNCGGPDVSRRLNSSIMELISNIMIERSEGLYRQPDRKVQLFDALLDRAREEVLADKA